MILKKKQTKSTNQTKNPTPHPPLFLSYFYILYPVVLPTFFLKYHRNRSSCKKNALDILFLFSNQNKCYMPFCQKTLNLLHNFEVTLWLHCAATGEASSYCNEVGFWCLGSIRSDANLEEESYS